MKVNYDKGNVDDQQVDKKHCKEQCDIEDEDEVQKTTVTRTPMKKYKSVCVTCYQTFAMKNGSKNLFRKSKQSSVKLLWQNVQK